MENIASGQGTKEGRKTYSDPLAVVQSNDGSGLAKTGSMNLEKSAWVHVTFWKENSHCLLMH